MDEKKNALVALVKELGFTNAEAIAILGGHATRTAKTGLCKSEDQRKIEGEVRRAMGLPPPATKEPAGFGTPVNGRRQLNVPTRAHRTEQRRAS